MTDFSIYWNVGVDLRWIGFDVRRWITGRSEANESKKWIYISPFACKPFHFHQCPTPGVNFINILRTAFVLVDPKGVKRYWWLNYIFYAFGIYKCKSCTLNIDEIEPRCQFRQHFTLTFFCMKVIFCQNITREKLRKALLYEKHIHKMLMKLTPTVMSGILIEPL